MPEREKNKTPEEKQFEKFDGKYAEFLKDPNVSEIYKYELLTPDIILVLAKMKPMTEIHFTEYQLLEMIKYGFIKTESVDSDNKKELEKEYKKWLGGLKSVLSKNFGVSTSKNVEKEILHDKSITFNIFDPEQIEEKVKASPDLLPWVKTDNLEKWIKKNISHGISEAYIYGVIYGFPNSSVGFFVNSGSSLDNVNHQVIDTYGEAYGVPEGELSVDVKAREEQKKKLFGILSKNKVISSKKRELNEFKYAMESISGLLDPEKRNFNVPINKFIKFLQDKNILNDYKKMIDSNEAALLVVNKLSPAAELNLSEEDLQKSGFDKLKNFKRILNEKFGIIVAEKNKIKGKNSAKEFVLYNTLLLKEKIREQKDLLPWDENDDFNSWFKKNIDKGLKEEYIWSIITLLPGYNIKKKEEIEKRFFYWLKGNEEYYRVKKKIFENK